MKSAKSRINLDDLSLSSGASIQYEKCSGVHEYIERRADQDPQAIALKYKSETLSYLQLDQRANQLAHCLRDRGIGRGDLVAISMERSLEMLIAIFAVLKAGAAYVPLDPDLPQERFSFLIEDIEASVVLTQNHLLEKFKGAHEKRALAVDSNWDQSIAKMPRDRLPCCNEPDDIAYVIFTSGSTGKPKGCLVTHKGIANCIQWEITRFVMTSKDKMLFKTPFSFDFSVPEFLWPLCSGATLVIAEPGKHKDPLYIRDIIRTNTISHAQFVPSMLQIFLEEDMKACQSLRVVVAAGEALPIEVVKRFYQRLPQAKLVNIYGPTETAGVGCTFWECERQPDFDFVPIGHALPNNHLYVLDEKLEPVAKGSLGELYVGGVQVARGYWKRPDLTAERFLPDPFSENARAKMYKTGDSVRMMPDGLLEYRGRIDHQVKVRGMRVELGEIESAILETGIVSNASVVFKKLHGETNAGSLVAYLVGREGENTDVSQLSELLRKKLPDFMMPSLFEILKVMPLNPNGKIDRQVLTARKDEGANKKRDIAQPRTETEKQLKKIFESVFALGDLGIDEEFLKLGGDSLMAMRIMSLVNRNFGSSLPVKDIYDGKSMQGLGRIIDDKLRTSQRTSRSFALEPSKGNGPFHCTFAQSAWIEYYVDAPADNRDNEVVALKMKGLLDARILEESIEYVIQRHEVLRTRLSRKGSKFFQSYEAEGKGYFFAKNLRSISADEKSAREVFHEIASRQLGLFDSRLFECHLVQFKGNEALLVLIAHHAIVDGLSIKIILDDLEEFYNSAKSKIAPRLAAHNMRYADFAALEAKQLDANSLGAQETKLKDLCNTLANVELPTDFARPANSTSGPMKIVRKSLGRETSSAVKALAIAADVTPNIVCLTAFSNFLSRLTKQRNIPILITTSLRTLPEIQDTVGIFMDYVLLKCGASEVGFNDHAKRLQNDLLEALAPQVSFYKLMESTSKNGRLFGTFEPRLTFVFSDFDIGTLNLKGLATTSWGLHPDFLGKGWDLSAEWIWVEQDLVCEFYYRTDLFAPETVIGLLDQYFEVLGQTLSQIENNRSPL